MLLVEVEVMSLEIEILDVIVVSIKIFKTGRRVPFGVLAPPPVYKRPENKRKKVFKSHWMTTDENFKIVKASEMETAQKEANKAEDQKVAKQAISQARKLKRKKVVRRVRKIKSNPKL